MSSAGIAATSLFFMAVNPAQATSPGPGQGEAEATLSSTSFISVSGSTVTFTLPSNPVTITTGEKSGNLLGISGLWIVDQNGHAISGITATQGSVATAAGSVTSWNALLSSGGFAGFHNDARGTGFGGNDDWLQLADNSLVLSGSGKAGSGDVLGSFTFAGLSGASNYTLAVDYLGAWDGGQTGRAYITNYSVSSSPSPVPEPGLWVTGSTMGGMMLLGLVRGRRRPKRA